MEAIDFASLPEAARHSLLPAIYEMTQRQFKDPAVRAEYEEWLRKRNEQKGES